MDYAVNLKKSRRYNSIVNRFNQRFYIARNYKITNQKKYPKNFNVF